MPEQLDAPVSSHIDPEALNAFANALRSGDFTARLPHRESDDAATEATINFNSFAQFMELMVTEITRLSTELQNGIFGGQAEFLVSLRRGPWRSSIEAFNEMEWALTEQIRDIAKAARRLAAGRTDYTVTCECKGEMLALKNSMNALVEQAKTRSENPASKA